MMKIRYAPGAFSAGNETPTGWGANSRRKNRQPNSGWVRQTPSWRSSANRHESCPYPARRSPSSQASRKAAGTSVIATNRNSHFRQRFVGASGPDSASDMAIAALRVGGASWPGVYATARRLSTPVAAAPGPRLRGRHWRHPRSADQPSPPCGPGGGTLALNGRGAVGIIRIGESERLVRGSGSAVPSFDRTGAGWSEHEFRSGHQWSRGSRKPGLSRARTRDAETLIEQEVLR